MTGTTQVVSPRAVASVGDASWMTTATAVLSQDVVVTAQIVVDANSARPVGTFPSQVNVDPVTGASLVEAVAIVALESNGGVPLPFHVTRNSSSESGWVMNPIATVSAQDPVVEICAGVDLFGDVQAFFTQSGQVYNVTLNQNVWSTPQSLYAAALTSLMVAYSQDGALLVAGLDGSGNLVIGSRPDETGGYGFECCPLSTPLSASASMTFAAAAGGGWIVAAVQDRQVTLIEGQAGNTAVAETVQTLSLSAAPSTVGCGYYSPTAEQALFLLTCADGGIYTLAANGVTQATNFPLASTTMAGLTAQVGTDDQGGETIRLYGTDGNNALWALSLIGWNGTEPQWGPWIPLSGGVGMALGDMSPTSSPSLFTIDDQEGALGLWVLDTGATGQWRNAPIYQPGENTTAFEVVRYRCEFAVLDQNNQPMVNQPLNLMLGPNCSTVDVSIAGQSCTLDSSQTPVSVTSDSFGKVTVSLLVTSSLAAPNLVLSTTDGAQSAACQVNGGVMAYLGGGGTPYNPTNPQAMVPIDPDGQTLATAQYPTNDNGQYTYTHLASALTTSGPGTLAATASQGIRTMATTQPTATMARRRRGAATAPSTGFALSLVAGQPHFRLLSAPDDFAAYATEFRQTARRVHGEAMVGGIWSDLGDLASDVWQGINNGLLVIENALVDVVNGVVEMTVKICDEISQFVSIAIASIDDLAHAIGGILQAVEADIENVIDWLKALFDFGAIWRTKTALQAMFTSAMGNVPGAIDGAENVFNTWIDGVIADVENYFGQLESQFGAGTWSAQPGFIAPGATPSTSVKLAGNATSNDVGNNVHHNWLLDKVTGSNGGGSPAIPEWSATQIANSNAAFSPLGALLNPNDPNYDASNQTSQLFTSFSAQASDFMTSTGLSTGSVSLGDLVVADMLEGLQTLVVTALQLVKALVDDFLSLMAAVCGDITQLLDASWDLGPLNALWDWVAAMGGQPGGDTLCMASLLALVVAFPTTLLYKLIEGVGDVPFPAAQAVRGGKVGDTAGVVALVGEIITLIGHIPDAFASIGSACNTAFIRYWRAFTKVVHFMCVTFNEDILPWIEANPGATIFVIWMALVLFTSVSPQAVINALYAVYHESESFIAGVSLLYAIWQVCEDNPGTAEAVGDITEPMPDIINAFFPNGWLDAGPEACAVGAILCCGLWATSGIAKVVAAAEDLG